MARLALLLVIVLGLALLWFWLAATGHWGQRQGGGVVTAVSRSVPPKSNAEGSAGAGEKQILFGDLHTHSTFSFDANTISLPMYGGKGSHSPADACDFARYCAGLDFWSINDHAEGLTPSQWSMTRDIVRQCNDVAGDPSHPDMVTFLGWEWTQIGDAPNSHYGHKNVVLRDTEEGRVPARPISARAQLYPGDGVNPYGFFMRSLMIAMGLGGQGRQPYHDFARFLQDRDELISCPPDVPVRELPEDCQESAFTPAELFGKLDDWGFPYLVIPHGNTWGFYTPPLTRWDKQLAAHTDPVRHEPLIEVFSGHGNIEEYRSWRALVRDNQGGLSCPPPTEAYLPECWRAGQIIEERCLAQGEEAAECSGRAAAARANFILAGDSGHWTIPGTRVEDWLDAGQCRDCYMPAYNHRPTSSVQYGLAITDFSRSGETPKRFRWGLIGSSDVHSARPGTGYKESMRIDMTDARLGLMGPPPELARQEPVARHQTLEQVGLAGPYFQRFASFFGTGGLVAVHSSGRDRGSIWQALHQREVYGTSGDRILLWFDLLQPDGSVKPMGSIVEQGGVPQFEVRALGALEQLPGCPQESVSALPPDRLQRLCRGECFHPGNRRKPIERIEVVRIRPQSHPGESVDKLVEDPWRILPCPADGEGCTVRFSDPDYSSGQRDAVYYVRAIERATPTVNAGQLRCELDARGRCIDVNPCYAAEPTDRQDNCLTLAEERAWSSPIFVDYPRSSRISLSASQ